MPTLTASAHTTNFQAVISQITMERAANLFMAITVQDGYSTMKIFNFGTLGLEY